MFGLAGSQSSQSILHLVQDALSEAILYPFLLSHYLQTFGLSYYKQPTDNY